MRFYHIRKSKSKNDIHFYNTIFVKSKLIMVESERTNFEKAIFDNSMLMHSNFSNSSFKESDLSQSILRYSNFNNCDLRGCNLSCEIIEECTFKKAIYDEFTIWPKGFVPAVYETILIS